MIIGEDMEIVNFTINDLPKTINLSVKLLADDVVLSLSDKVQLMYNKKPIKSTKKFRTG